MECENMMQKRIINPEHIKSLIEMLNNAPYYQLLGLRVTKLESGYAEVIMNAEKKHWNPFGSLHEGAYASLMDTAVYWAAYCDLEEDTGFTSLDLSVTNLAMSSSGILIARGNAIKEGRSTCLCEGMIYDENGKKLAHGTSKLLILQNRQTVSDAMQEMGYSSLPNKFIYSEGE